MGFHLSRAVYDSGLHGRLKPMAALLAHLCIDPEARSKHEPCVLFANVASIASRLGIEESNARKQMKLLVRIGVLDVVEPGGGRRRMGKRMVGIATKYRFVAAKLPKRGALYPHTGASVAGDTQAPVLGYEPHTLAQVPGPYLEVRTPTKNKDMGAAGTATAPAAPSSNDQPSELLQTDKEDTWL